MDILKELLDLIVMLTWAAIGALAALLQQVVGAMGQLSQTQAQMCASLILFGVVGAWFVRKVNWFKLKMLAPQTVTLRTEKTPIQVVMEDLGGCLVSLVFLVVLLAIGYAFLKGR